MHVSKRWQDRHSSTLLITSDLIQTWTEGSFFYAYCFTHIRRLSGVSTYSFSQLLKHIFWKHASFSQNSKHKSQNHSHKMQNPLYLLQKATLLSKQCYVASKGYFVFKWQTQTIIWVDILSIDWTLMCSMENTTMKWENTSMKALSGALCLFMSCYCTLSPVVKYCNCIMFLLKYKTTHKYTVTTKICLYFFPKVL